MFVNSVTYSHVNFQGYSYEFCFEQAYKPPLPYPAYESTQLDVVFYESPSFNGSTVGNTIRNTSFAFYEGSSDGNDILQVLQFSKEVSYQVAIEYFAWCNNSIFSPFKWFQLLHAVSFFRDTTNQPSSSSWNALHLNMSNVLAQYNIHGDMGSIIMAAWILQPSAASERCLYCIW
jgi:hypothetical protein